MANIHKEIMIEVQREKVFEFVAHTPNLVEVWPNLLSISNWERDENGLGEFTFTYNMGGFHFNGKNKDFAYEYPTKIVTISEGGLRSTVTWDFAEKDGGTHITFTGEYEVTFPLAGKLIAQRIADLNNIEVEALLKNIKKKLEAE